ncbi:MAG: hypothetical protein ACI4WW_01375 [Candidatus Coprovivens sp.]
MDNIQNKFLYYILFYIRKFIFLVLSIILAIAVCIGLYYAYQDMTGSSCKEYLIEEYDFGTFDIFTKKTTVYVMNDEADCNSLWLKKCTDDKNLVKEVIFVTKDGNKIHVIEHKDGTFEDDYKEKEDN